MREQVKETLEVLWAIVQAVALSPLTVCLLGYVLLTKDRQLSETF